MEKMKKTCIAIAVIRVSYWGLLGLLDMERTLEILDKHMECIRALYPKEYSAIMRMLKD